MNLPLTLLIVYSIALIAVGLWVGRLVRGSGDFFVAGRRLSAPVAGQHPDALFSLLILRRHPLRHPRLLHLGLEAVS